MNFWVKLNLTDCNYQMTESLLTNFCVQMNRSHSGEANQIVNVMVNLMVSTIMNEKLIQNEIQFYHCPMMTDWRY